MCTPGRTLSVSETSGVSTISIKGNEGHVGIRNAWAEPQIRLV